jgi:hypothetical protein
VSDASDIDTESPSLDDTFDDTSDVVPGLRIAAWAVVALVVSAVLCYLCIAMVMTWMLPTPD